jgi:hypothetical protein
VGADKRPSPNKEKAALVFEAARTTAHAVRHKLRPDPLDNAGIVITVGEIVIEG